MSARVEYNYLAFGHASVRLTDQAGNELDVALDQYAHLVKLGLNYKLGGPFGAPARLSTAALPSWNWSGFYAGVHAGGGWGMTDWNSATGPLAASPSGFPGSGGSDAVIAGGQIGYNQQIGPFVAGAEIDASWSNLDGIAKCATTEQPAGSFSCHTRIDALGTIAGRLGWSYGNLLVYGKAGGAWAHEKHDAYKNGTASVFAGDTLRWGYVLGSGFEYAFTPAWSGKIEYNFLDFGTRTIALRDQFGGASDVEIGQRAHLLKMGLNYRLGADPATPGSSGNAAILKAPPRSSDWTINVGTRYWFSSGKMQKDLYEADVAGLLNSRLIYGGATGHSAETFARFDHRSGVFAKANIGLGTLVNGTLNDEDFPPDTSPYSNTEHRMKDGGLRYGSLDIGYNVLSGSAGKFGAYAGYRYFYQRGRGFGCDQIGAGTPCDTPATIVGLSETEQWRGAAFGLNAQLALTDRWALELDAAYLPYVDRAGVDNHWLAADNNPSTATGHGWGTQVEAILSYAITDRLNVGVGGRYWFFTTTEGTVRFPNSLPTSPIKFTSDRYGGFLQASYKIGGPDVAKHPAAAIEATAPTNWTGWYVGGHFGAGFGGSAWSDPFPPPPTGDRVSVGGALGGVQIGLNYQTGQVVLGAEVAASSSRIDGTETCFGGLQPATLAGLNCANTTTGIATLTGRVGYAAGQSLFYAKAGGALARETYTLNSTGIPGGRISSTSTTNLGWTVGGGIEHALTPRWSVSAEYRYLDFGSRSVNFFVPNVIAAASTELISTQRHLVTMGVNYRFGGPFQ